jgi:hypothetical protein
MYCKWPKAFKVLLKNLNAKPQSGEGARSFFDKTALGYCASSLQLIHFRPCFAKVQ